MSEISEDTLEGLTPEELVELQQYALGSAPMPKEQHNIHKFLYDVSVSDDTTKTGYLTVEELGMPKLPVRTLKELALFCSDIAGMDYFAEVFKKESEITTSTSLSKDAKLLSLAVISRRQLEDVTKTPGKENKGWFKKKKKGGSEHE